MDTAVSDPGGKTEVGAADGTSLQISSPHLRWSKGVGLVLKREPSLSLSGHSGQTCPVLFRAKATLQNGGHNLL